MKELRINEKRNKRKEVLNMLYWLLCGRVEGNS